jgi:hypothetical protein
MLIRFMIFFCSYCIDFEEALNLLLKHFYIKEIILLGNELKMNLFKNDVSYL